MSHPYSMDKRYRAYQPKQLMLLPPSIDEWLPEDHIARFPNEAIEAMDIHTIEETYEQELRGYPPYHPRLMLKVLICDYCMGVRPSRKIAQECVENVAFRYLAANQFPNFQTVSGFRKRHIDAFSVLFLEVLKLRTETGLANVGHVALDGSKIAANASRHKAMSYGRMKTEEARLAKEIAEIIAQAQATGDREDSKIGKDKVGNELPGGLRHREARLKKIEEAKAALERRAAERHKEQ